MLKALSALFPINNFSFELFKSPFLSYSFENFRGFFFVKIGAFLTTKFDMGRVM